MPRKRRCEMKNIFLLGFLLIFLPFKIAAGDDSEINSSVKSETSVKINIFADKFLTGLWPQLSESYRMMAFISASMMVEREPQDKMTLPSAPLVGVSLIIEW